jgi:formylglycine-generating enzyme required for sulfatase activity
LYQVHGNVWEWTEDCWHSNYKATPDAGTPWLNSGGGDCSRRIARGGSWNNDLKDLRSAARLLYPTAYRSSDLGFRVGRTLAP